MTSAALILAEGEHHSEHAMTLPFADFWFGVIALAAFMTLLAISSSSMLALAIQVCMIVYERLFRPIWSKWIVLGLAAGAFLLSFELIFGMSIGAYIATELSLNQAGAETRLDQITYGLKEVWRHPVFGIGLNYVEHVAESARTLDTARDLPKQPVIFSKPPTAVIGPGEPIRHDAALTQQLDWEVELACIIGRTARRVAEADALSHVFGYSVMIDVSARDNRRAGQWIYSKGMDSFAPFGPCIVTADEIPDPQVLDLWLTKNGEEKQRSNTRHMLFKVATLIADISAGITLEPGDIIATGTPEGVGAGRDPQEWMWPGDVIEATVAGIGTIRHPVVAV